MEEIVHEGERGTCFDVIPLVSSAARFTTAWWFVFVGWDFLFWSARDNEVKHTCLV